MAKRFSCWVIVAGAQPTAFRARQAEEAFAARRRASAARDRDWRPGGSHVDPRAKYQITRDEKRARFKRRLIASKTNGTGDGKPGQPRRDPQSRGPRSRGPKGSR
jgi:hypothetical protein